MTCSHERTHQQQVNIRCCIHMPSDEKNSSINEPAHYRNASLSSGLSCVLLLFQFPNDVFAGGSRKKKVFFSPSTWTQYRGKVLGCSSADRTLISWDKPYTTSQFITFNLSCSIQEQAGREQDWEKPVQLPFPSLALPGNTTKFHRGYTTTQVKL